MVFLFSSCQPGGTPTTQTQVSIPTAWKASGTSASARISSGWVKDLNDSRVSKLVDEAMKQNPDLLATAERLKAARASLVRARANRMPSVDASGSGSRSRTNRDAAGGTRSYASGRRVSIGASWELDLWGRLRNLHTASRADYDATVADFRGTRLALAASTASLWYNLISAENQVQLARQTLASYQKVKKIIERNYKAGTARALALQLSRNNVYNGERVLRSRLQRRDDARRNLEIVLGRYPSGKLGAPATLPTIRRNVPAGLPAGLLSRRPDLVQARKRLEASFQRAIASQKNLLPSVRLTGSSGTASSGFSDLLDPGFLSSSISASLGQSIFEGGSLREDARAAVARNKAAVHDFANTALRAFREVESALASEHWLKEQEFFLRKELEQAALAERQAERDYAEGVDGVDIIDLLESQRRAVNARSSLIDLQNRRIQNRINLHLALGGDFATQ
ncbi:MAG: efflux transporter outer membrane subunit [Akkermansiaceae bacterium]